MDHLVAQALAIAKRTWKYRWTGVLVAWLTGVIGAIVVFTIPDRYEASARIYVDTQSILKPLMAGLTVQPNVEQQVTYLSRTLISRPNVEKLIHMADLDLKNQTKAQQEALIDDLTARLSIQSTARDNLYTLTFRDSDPAAAKRVVQSLVSIFVESSLGRGRQDATAASTFINEQIKNYEAKLEDAENRLKEFRLRNLNYTSGDGKDAASHIGEIQQQLDAARLEYREATNARDAARGQLSAMNGGSAASAAGPSTTQSLIAESDLQISTPDVDARIDAQQRRLDELLQRYTEQHPDVVATRKSIAELEKEKRKEIQEKRRAALATPSLALGGAQAGAGAQEAAKLLTVNEIQVASLRARVTEYETRYSQALAALRTAPQIEAEYAQLNRDYAVNKQNYEDLVKRREAASISSDLDGATGFVDMRLIDPPRVSPQPVAPNRLLFLAAALLGSLVAGLFGAFAASQLRPVFLDAAELRERLELPVLGVVTRLVTEADRRRARLDLYRFGAASGGLVGLFVIGLTVMAVVASQRVS